MRRALTAVLLFAAAAASASEKVTHAAGSWTRGVIVYDGTGNIARIGLDAFLYDTAGRIVSGTVGTATQTFGYDSFGNRIDAETNPASTRCWNGTDCEQNFTIDPATNRIESNQAEYDEAGNLISIDTNYHFAYDAAGMVVKQTAPGVTQQFIYSVSDERVATYNAGSWTVTLRDLDNRPIRELTATDSSVLSPSSWTWRRDYVYREGALLATESATGRRDFHVDHLGTPRIITDAAGRRVGEHSYLPFGAELESALAEVPEERLKFTGHERDLIDDVHTLDYMHARYYAATTGRFLSADPILGDPAVPQSWNRYAYARNNPLLFTDPTGEYVDVSNLTPDEKLRLLAGLEAFTDNKYAIVNNRLELVKIGQNSSPTANAFFNGLVNDPNKQYLVVSTTKGSWYNDKEQRVEINFKSFDQAEYRGIDQRTFNLGSTVIHELLHQVTGLEDTVTGMNGGPQPTDTLWTGPVVDYVNVMRAERGLPTRAAYFAQEHRGRGFWGFLNWNRHSVRFLDPQTGKIRKVVRNGRATR